jgi:phosphatidylglycerophosphatase C
VSTVVAAFDVDGTLTRRDTFAPFLFAAFGRRRVAGGMVRHVGLARHRDDYKAAVVRTLFAGRPTAPLVDVAEQFAAGAVPGRLRPGALELLAEHRRLGHRVVLVSASLTLYLDPIAQLLGGVDGNVSTRLGVDGDVFTGELEGGNCRGPAKADRVEAWLATQGLARAAVTLIAYGNSAGDRELLAAADRPVRVRSNADLTLPADQNPV